MNKKVSLIVLVLGLLMLFAALAPVMAAPATKIEEVTFTASTTTVPNPGYPRLVAHDTILISKGTSTGAFTLSIPGQDPLVGDWYSEWISRNKWSGYPVANPEAEALIESKVVLTITDKGTFEGTSHRVIIGFPISGASSFEDRMVLHGTGDFKGQTLKLTNSEGYIIIPK